MNSSSCDGGNSLKIGDYVTLKHAKPQEGWLSSEGMLSDAITSSKDETYFENCIWEVHVQNQYTAVKEYEEALYAELCAADRGKKIETLHSGMYSSEHLGKAASNEERMNEKLMSLKLGKPVTYGDVIQLRHVKSNKFLTVSPILALAKDEKENLRVSLERYGDSTSWLEIIPRSVTDNDDQQIANDTEVILAVHERPMEYIHCASRPASNGIDFEVNCSLSSSSWTISIFQHRQSDITTVFSSDIVALHASDISSFLTVSPSAPIPVVEYTHYPQLHSSQGISNEFRVGTGALWMIEKQNLCVGGAITITSGAYVGSGVKLRHLNSGLYMNIDDRGTINLVTDHNTSSTFHISLAHQKKIEEYQTLSSETQVLIESNGSWLYKTFLQKDRLRLSQTMMSGSETVPLCSTTHDKAKASAFNIIPGLYKSMIPDVFLGIASVDYLNEFQEAIRSFRETNGNMRKLDKYVASLLDVLNAIHESLSDSTLKHMESDPCGNLSLSGIDVQSRRKSLRQMMLREQGVLDVILDIIELCNLGYFDDIHYVVVPSDSNKVDQMSNLKTPALAAQKRKSSIKILSKDTNALVSKEQQLIRKSLLGSSSSFKQPKRRVTLLAVLSDDDEEEEDEGTHTKEESKMAGKVALITQRHTSGVNEEQKEGGGKSSALTFEVSKLCFKILLSAIKCNQTNQIHLADRFPVILSQLQVHELAVQCIQEMLRDNLQMLSTKVNEQVIARFVGMLRESPMNLIFLQLLQNTCACPMGVDSTQCMVATQLMGDLDAYDQNSVDQLRRAVSMEADGGEEELSDVDVRGRSSSDVIDFSGNTFPSFTEPTIATEVHSNSTPLVSRDSVLVKATMRYDLSSTKDNSWPRNNKYIPSSSEIIGDNIILGSAILSQGLPEIFLTWEAPHEYSMQSLFNCSTSVPYDTFMDSIGVIDVSEVVVNSDVDHLRGLSKARSRSIRISKYEATSKPNNGQMGILKAKTKLMKRMYTAVDGNSSDVDYKKHVIKYFASQLYLMADLCLDRNYVSIRHIERVCPYELLITLLMHEKSPSIIKAPICKMLRCVFVDRAPHVEIMFPRLIRFGENAGADESVTSKVFKFGMVQQIISEYMNGELNLDQCDELAVEMMDLLLSLVSFGFYSTQTLLEDIVTPLTGQLSSHRDVDAHDLREDSNVSDHSVVSSPYTLTKNAKILPESAKVKSFAETNESSRIVSRTISSLHASFRGKLLDRASSRTLLEESVAEEKHISWQERVLSFTETFYYNIWMLFLITISVAIVVCTLVPWDEALEVELSLLVVDRVVTALFILDLTTRVYCNFIVNNEFASFFTELYKLIDVVVIVIDILIIFISSAKVLSSPHAFSRLLRILRVLRLARVCRIVKMLLKITKKNDETYEYIMPNRYKNLTKHESRTISGIMRILSMTHDHLQDKKIDCLVRKFSTSFDKSSNGSVSTIAEVVYSEVQSENPILQHFSADLIDVLLDFLMYDDDTIVLEALRLLMSHVNHEQQFFKVAYKTHVITSPQLSALATETMEDIHIIKHMADSFEIWREFRSPRDFKCAEDLIHSLENVCRRGNFRHGQLDVLDANSRAIFEELQTVLFKIDAFGSFVSLQKVILESDNPPFSELVEKIILRCNDAIILFVHKNELNQRVAFREFTWFLDKTEYGLNFSKVVRAILSDNNRLIKQCPMSWVSFCINNVINHGKKSEYLDVLIGMTALDESYGINIISKEVSRYMTSREHAPRIIEWCVSEHHNEYSDRVDAMQPFLSDDVRYRDDELSPSLQYHINLLVLLRNCALGPKLEAVYHMDDVIVAILDHDTLINVRVPLGGILLDLVVHVPGCECSENLWQFFDYVTDLINNFSKVYLNKDARAAKEYFNCEYLWLSVCLQICHVFFENFDLNDFAEYQSQKTTFLKTSRSEEEIDNQMDKLGKSIAQLKNADSRHPFKDSGFMAMVNSTLGFLESEENTRIIVGVLRRDFSKRSLGLNRHTRAASTSSDLAFESHYRKRFEDFLDVLASSRGKVAERTIRIFESLYSVTERVDADIRLEPIISRIVKIIRSRIKCTAVSKFGLTPMLTDIAKWLLDCWTSIITKELKLSLVELAEFQRSKDIPDSTPFQTVLNNCGVTALCLDLIAMGIDVELCTIAMKLLVALLAKNNGHREVQESVYEFLKNTDSVLFFEKVRDIIEKSTVRHEGHGTDEECLMKHRDGFFVFTLIEFMCAGNFVKNQDMLREQPTNSRVVNILFYLTQCLKSLSKLNTHDEVMAAAPVVVAAISTLRGPAVIDNKEYFALHSSILPVFKYMIRSTSPPITASNPALWLKEYELLRSLIIDMLQTMVEGLAEDNVVIDRIKIVMELKILHIFLMPPETNDYGEMIEISKLTSLQEKYIVLLKTVGIHEMPPNVKASVGDDFATLEVLWHGIPHVYYCYLPKLASGLVEESSRRFLEDVRIDSQEILLKDFMKIAGDLRRATVHHSALEKYGLANITGVNKSLSWVMLTNVVLINFLLLMYYNDNTSNGKHLSDDVDYVVFILNVVQLIMACASLAMVFTSHVPVLYGAYRDMGQNHAWALIKSVGDIESIWKVLYLFFCILAIWWNYLFLSVLLLEFVVMNSTCRDIVKAVLFPAKQLMATVFIIIVVLNVFGGVLFTFYRQDVSLEVEIHTLFDAIKYATTYGVRSSGAGLGAYMQASVGNRFIMDMIFFIVFNAILMEVFFGVIIDTFGEIRDLKAQRENHFANKCYICGVDARAFVKAGPHAFSTHVNSKHNIWNYLYFVMRLWQQPRHKDDSVELYIRQIIESGDDISWFPIGILRESTSTQP